MKREVETSASKNISPIWESYLIALDKNNSDDKYDLVYDSLTNAYNKIDEFADTLASKAGNIAGFAGVILTLSATLWWDIYKSNVLNYDMEIVNIGFAFIFGTLFFAMLFALVTFFTTDYAVVPGPNYLFRVCFNENWPRDKILKMLCDGTRNATEENIKIIDMKSREIRCSMVCLGISILSLMCVAIYIIFFI